MHFPEQAPSGLDYRTGLSYYHNFFPAPSKGIFQSVCSWLFWADCAGYFMQMKMYWRKTLSPQSLNVYIDLLHRAQCHQEKKAPEYYPHHPKHSFVK